MQKISHRKSSRSWKDSNQNLGYNLLFFVLWPFVAWLIALRNANKKSSFIIFFLFDLLLLWHMAPTDYGNGYHDFIGIMERFQYTTFTLQELLYRINDFFSFSDDAPKEIYEDILIWLVKTFIANNYHFYFLLAAIPVAYCQLNILQRVVSDSRSIMSLSLLIVLILLIIPRDIIAVQNPRFTTGFWVCAMSSIAYFYDKNKIIYIFLILLSPVFHSGMWPFVGIFFVGQILNKCERPLEIAAYASIPLLFFDANLFSDLDYSFLPAGLSKWVDGYMSEETYKLRVLHVGRAGFWWVNAFFVNGQKLVYIYMTIKLIKERKYIKTSKETARFYPFYLLIFAFVNSIQFVPELGNRYYGFLRVFCVFLWFKTFYPNYNKVIYVLFAFSTWYIVSRYGYILGGALSINTPIDIFITPLPFLMGKGLLW